MVFDSAAWIKRASEVMSLGDSTSHGVASEATQFATSLLTVLYGPQSTQLKAFSAGCDAISKMKPGTGSVPVQLCRHARGAITNAKAELEAGLVGSLRVQVTGEVLADLVGLGKEILAEGTETSKNVAAVLVAVAF